MVAKRSPRDKAVVEQTMYERVLSQLHSSPVRYHGLVNEDESKYAWIFLDDAGQSRVVETDRAVVFRWLGDLHWSTSRLAESTSLPLRGASHYLRHLIEGRERLRHHATALGLDDDDQRIVRSLICLCDSLETGWGRIAEFLAELPETVLHGDFVAKNMRLCGSRLAVYDWATAGRGVPAPDLAELSTRLRETPAGWLDEYRESSRTLWTDLDRSEFAFLCDVGLIFRLLASIDWASYGLAHQWFQRPMRQLRSYETKLDIVTQAAGLRS